MVNVLKQLKNIKHVNETLKNEFNERKNHDKKSFTTVFFIFQRTFKFPYPERYKKIREKFESFKYIFRVKFRTNYDWYPTKNIKFDYVFFCFKNVVRI